MKKNILRISGLISSVFLILGYIGTYRLCGAQEYGDCMDLLHNFFALFTPFIPLFLFSLITYRMRESVYRAWVRFVYVWIPLSMILIFLAPEYSNDWMFPVTKASVAFVTFWIFVIISSLIIIYKYIATRGKGK